MQPHKLRYRDEEQSYDQIPLFFPLGTKQLVVCPFVYFFGSLFVLFVSLPLTFPRQAMQRLLLVNDWKLSTFTESRSFLLFFVFICAKNTLSKHHWSGFERLQLIWYWWFLYCGGVRLVRILFGDFVAFKYCDCIVFVRDPIFSTLYIQKWYCSVIFLEYITF